MQKSVFTKKRILQDIVLVAMLLFFLFMLFTQQGTLDRNIEEYENLQAEVQKMKNENEALKKELERADTDEYKEEKIREVLGYVKPDETVFIEEEE